MNKTLLIASLIVVVFFITTKTANMSTWDKVTNRNIEKLHPAIRLKVTKFINDLYNQGIKARLYSGLRTFEEQTNLYNQGRTTSGKIVTNAKAGQSFHNYGLAFDIVEIKDGKAIWNNPNWNKIAEIGEKNGFESGHRWKFKDSPHFQKTFGYKYADLLAKVEQKDLSGNYVNIA